MGASRRPGPSSFAGVPERSQWQMVGWAALAVLAVVALVRGCGPGAGSVQSPPVRIDPGAAAPGGPSSRAAGARGGLYVHVAGEVRRPGLFRLAEGSRVAAAVARAGGPTRRGELTAVNLAQPLEDGQQVIVPRVGTAPVAAGAVGAGAVTAGATAAGTAPLSLATATPEQLEELDGIGPTLAQRIIEFRDARGGFRSLGQLQEIDGIGEKRFAALREAVRP